MILVENGIILKNHVCCNFIAAKILHQDFIPTIHKTLNQFFYWFRQTKTWKFTWYLFDVSHWANQISFEVLSLDNNLINGDYVENAKYVRWELKYISIWFLFDCCPQWSNYSKNFWILARSQISLHLKWRNYFICCFIRYYCNHWYFTRNNPNSAWENIKSSKLVLIQKRCIRENLLTNWSLQQTLNKWIAVCHFTCQVKSSWSHACSVITFKEFINF